MDNVLIVGQSAEVDGGIGNPWQLTHGEEVDPLGTYEQAQWAILEISKIQTLDH